MAKFLTRIIGQRLSIRARLMILVALIMAPLAVDRLIALGAARQDRLHLARVELTELARDTAMRQHRLLSAVEAVLETLAYVQGTVAKDNGCAQLFYTLPLEHTGLRGVAVVTPEGFTICATAAIAMEQPARDMPVVREALSTKHFAVGALRTNPARDSEASLMVAYPIAAARNEPAGVILAAIDPEAFARTLSAIDERAGIVATLIDSRGTVIAATHATALAPATRLPADVLARVSAQNDQLFSVESLNGRPHLVVQAPLATTGLRLLMGIDQQAVLDPVHRDMMRTLASLVAMGLIMLGLAWIVIDRMVMRPIVDLADTAAAIGRDDAPLQLDKPWAREFAPLVTAFQDLHRRLVAHDRELRQANNRLAVQASVDGLSGLANRRGFDSRLDFEWLRCGQIGAPLGFLMIDIDYFKQFNDSYGHLAGDEALRKISAVLKRRAMEEGGFAARFGGEEFLMILPGLGAEATVAIADKIRRSIEALDIAHMRSPERRITVSIGAAAMIPDRGEAQQLVGAADAGLYAAKHQGRNQVILHAPLRSGGQPTAAVA